MSVEYELPRRYSTPPLQTRLSPRPSRRSHEANVTPRPLSPSAPPLISTEESGSETYELPGSSLHKPLPKAPEGSTHGKGDGEALDRSASIAHTLSPIREFLFVTIICLAQFMTQAALGQCLSILHIIGQDFGITNPGRLSWLIAGYSLTVGTFILIAGRLGDVFGYKRMLIIGFSWFTVWSVVEGLASYSGHVLFIFARVFAGIGPAITLTNGLAILGASYAPGPKKGTRTGADRHPRAYCLPSFRFDVC